MKIALVGKYVELHDAYMSVREALKHAGMHLGVEVNLNWVHSADLEKGKGWDASSETQMASLFRVDLAAGGLKAKSRRSGMPVKNKIPYLGLCLGMQLMVVEFARTVLGR